MKTPAAMTLMVALLLPLPTLACKCARMSSDERSKSADLVFTGRAGKSEIVHSGVWTRFEPIRLFKTESVAEKLIPSSPHSKENSILIIQELTSCQASFKHGKTYKIYAHVQKTADGRPFLTTGMCGVEQTP